MILTEATGTTGEMRLEPPGLAMAKLALALALGGCDPASDEPLADCSLEGEFRVELGQDRGGFVPLAAGEAPELIHGLQGGTHLLLAGRLRTPEPLERYEILLRAESGQDPCDLEGCASWTEIGAIATELDSRFEQITTTGPNEVELSPLFLVVDNWEAAPVRRLTLEVSDICQRHTISEHLTN